MVCNECKKRDMCVNICLNVQKCLSENYVSRRELPLQDRDLMLRREDHLRANRAVYEDRHSEYLPELYRRLDRLTLRQRKIIEMHFFDGMSTWIIARRLGITIRAANTRLRNAIERLRGNSLGDLKNDEK